MFRTKAIQPRFDKIIKHPWFNEVIVSEVLLTDQEYKQTMFFANGIPFSAPRKTRCLVHVNRVARLVWDQKPLTLFDFFCRRPKTMCLGFTA